MISSTKAWIAAVAFAFSLTSSAFGAGRVVTVQVTDSAGAPVAGARVLVGADEFDAVGTTDANGRVSLETTSETLQVNVEKGSAKASVTSSAREIAIRLAGGGK